jgi:hypothetical protein
MIANSRMRRRRIVCTAFGCATFFAHVPLLGAPPVAVQVDVPDVAKNVFVEDVGKTVALDKAIESAAASERVVAYRQLRGEVGGSGRGQLQIAQWCRQQRMAEEERLH